MLFAVLFTCLSYQVAITLLIIHTVNYNEEKDIAENENGTLVNVV